MRPRAVLRPRNRRRQQDALRLALFVSLSSALLGTPAPLHAAEDSPTKCPDGLGEEIESILARKEFATSSFGIMVAALDSGRVLFAHQSQKLFAPASTAKLVSCAGALAALGKDHRLITRVVAREPARGGVVRGDLTLVAAGDPNLSQRLRRRSPDALPDDLAFQDHDHSYCGLSDGELVAGDPLAVLHDLAARLRQRGVRRIRGDVVVDDGLFQESDDPFVGKFSAICINDNLVDVFISPGETAGRPARVRWVPQSTAVHVESLAKTATRGAPSVLWIEPGASVGSFRVRGTIALDAAETLRTVSVTQPTELAARYFVEALRNAGVEVDGGAAVRHNGPLHYQRHTTLALHTSAPLGAAIRVILKTSQNLHATMLPVLVGALRGAGGNRYAGFEVFSRQLRAMQIDPSDVTLASGSGGGREDQVSAHWLVDLLHALSRRDDFPVLLDALPVGGVDGTLAAQFRAPELAGRVRAKTGTLLFRSALDSTWVYASKALAGYILPDGRAGAADTKGASPTLAFAILIHGTRAPRRTEAKAALFRAQEDILRAVLRHSESNSTGHSLDTTDALRQTECPWHD